MLMEALQILKYHLKKRRLNYLGNWESLHAILVDDDPKEPDNTGRKRDGVADVHHSLQDLMLNIGQEEQEGLQDKVHIYA